MSSVNKVILLGNLGSDPETKFTSGGTARCSVNMATSERYKDKTTNEWQEKTEWHRLTAWEKTAEQLAKYHKGDTLFIEGQIQTRSWEGKDGKKNFTTEVIVRSIKGIVVKRTEAAASTAIPSVAGSAFGSDDADEIPF